MSTFVKQENTCARCNKALPPTAFPRTKSIFFPTGYLPLCGRCIDDFLEKNGHSWEAIDKVCQLTDIPFMPAEIIKMEETASDNWFIAYSEVMQGAEYEGVFWGDLNKEFERLRERDLIEYELPLIAEEKRRVLQEKWGAYDDEELRYLERFLTGLYQSQNVIGALQEDQAMKLAKISLQMDSYIREGNKDIDKLMGTYDKLIKAAEFTPKNAKNATDFDSVGELYRWLEKTGFVNRLYDDVDRDIVDSTLTNYKQFVRRLYIDESSMTEEIAARAMAKVNPKSDAPDGIDYNLDLNLDYDAVETSYYDDLLDEDEDFAIGGN